MLKAALKIENNKLYCQPLTWSILALIAIFLSILFYRLCVEYFQQYYNALAQGAAQTSLTQAIIKPFCSWCILLIMLALAFFSSTLMSQEFKQKTLYQWINSGYSASHVLLGKFLTLSGTVMIIAALALMMLITLAIDLDIEWGIIACSLAAILLLSSCILSFNLFIAALIPHPLLAMLISALLTFSWMLLEWLNPFAYFWPSLATHLSLLSHAPYLLNGIIYGPDITFYILFTFFWLFCCVRLLKIKMRRLI